MTFPAGVTLQVWRAVAGSSATVRTQSADEPGWAIAPPENLSDTAETGVNPQVLRDRRTGYKPSATALLASDEVEWGEGRFRVIGQPANWPNPWRGGVVGAVVQLERVTRAALVTPVLVETYTDNGFKGARRAEAVTRTVGIDETRKLVTGRGGSELSVLATLYVAIADESVFTPESWVTLRPGVRGTVVGVTRVVSADPGVAALDHLEVQLA